MLRGCGTVQLWLMGMTLSAAPALGQTTHTVELDGTTFVPSDLTVEVGDTIHWVWVSGFHNVESGVIVGLTGVPDGNFRSGDPTIAAGTTYDLVVDQAFLGAAPMPDGIYPYYCVAHTNFGMAGFITVVASEPLVADIDADGVVDLKDHALAVGCLSGTGSSVPAGSCIEKRSPWPTSTQTAT